MAAPIITPLPTPPSRQNSAGTFATQADLFMNALPTFGTQMNQTAAYVDTQAAAAEASAEKAATDGASQVTLASQRAAAAAASAQTAASHAQTAISNSEFSRVYRDSAQAAAAAAQASAGLPSLSGKAGLPLVVNEAGNGVGYSAKLRRYELALNSATTVIDLSLGNFFKIDASAARTIDFTNLPAANSSTGVTLDIIGGEKVTIPSVGRWHNSREFVQGTQWTLLGLVWAGDGWVGSVMARS